VTRDQAEARAAERNAARPEGDTRHWIAREGDDGEWALVSVRIPGYSPVSPLKATTEAKPRPPQADDPRTNVVRDVGGPYGPG
jgi:hypothetical protein